MSCLCCSSPLSSYHPLDFPFCHFSKVITMDKILNYGNTFLRVLSVTVRYRLWSRHNKLISLPELVIQSPLDQFPTPVSWFMQHKNPPSHLQIISSYALLRNRQKKFFCKVLPILPAIDEHSAFDYTSTLSVTSCHFVYLYGFSLLPSWEHNKHLIYLHFLPRVSPQTSHSVVVEVVEWMTKEKNNSQSWSWDFLSFISCHFCLFRLVKRITFNSNDL